MTDWKRIEYRGWKNCYQFENDSIKIIVTGDIGPRIIHFSNISGRNQFYEDPQDQGNCGGQISRLYGGHRFWTAPEDKERTYTPDNFPVEVEIEASVLRATAPAESCGIQKTILIEPEQDSNIIKITHLMENKGLAPLELAPWGLTMMRAGGTAIIPLPPKASHSALLTPTHSLALWSYTDLTDPRWGWAERFLFLRQDVHTNEPQKIGVHNTQGWGAYFNDGTLFVKMSSYSDESDYPDFGSNFEFFTNNHFLEIETLGGLSSIQPGQSVSHVEHWALFEGIKTVISESGVIQNILPLVDTTLHSLRTR